MAKDEWTPLKQLKSNLQHYTDLAKAHRADAVRSTEKAEQAEEDAKPFKEAFEILEAYLLKEDDTTKEKP